MNTIRVNGLGPDVGPDLGPNLFAKVITRRQKSLSARKELNLKHIGSCPVSSFSPTFCSRQTVQDSKLQANVIVLSAAIG